MKRIKTLAIIFSAMAFVTMSILGAVAYLQDSTAVKNTFTVGEVDIRLDEAIVDNGGVPVGDMDQDGVQDRTETGNTYHLIPGKSYTKDPTMTIEEGSEESYVRLLVTVNCYEELTAIFDGSFLLEQLVEGLDEQVWVFEGVAVDTNANTATYEYRYYKTVSAKDAELKLQPLFTKLTVPGTITGEELTTIANLEMDVEGHAIQVTGFENADKAWESFSR